MNDLHKIDLTELLRRKEIVEWQITIAKDFKRMDELDRQLEEINKQITKKQPIL